ncbi:MAG: pyridoxamine 5'-phosphate oxidase family protein, partial [Clostridia bacterium]|nr:pyridoxamine 5'-phosphate oxidase family protein [Clostridia bacterium]
LKENNKASFCVYDQGVKEADDWAYTVKSVIVFGKIKVINDEDIMKKIITDLCYKFTYDEEYINSEINNYLNQTILLELTPEHICGKKVKEA